MHKTRKDLLAGLAFVGFGLAFGYASLGYDLGTALRMGPGYFPLLLAGLLTALGAVIAVRGLAGGAGDALGAVPWRGLILLVAAVVVFGVAVRGLGLVPALLLTTFMSALASRRTGVPAALVLAAGLTSACVVIFIYGLGVPLRLFGPWLAF